MVVKRDGLNPLSPGAKGAMQFSRMISLHPIDDQLNSNRYVFMFQSSDLLMNDLKGDSI